MKRSSVFVFSLALLSSEPSSGILYAHRQNWGYAMELFQLEQFRAIVECGSISEAARRLYLTQPTLSHNLKKLESELGCKLFTRVRNRLQLTPCGEVTLEYYKKISQLSNEMLTEIDIAKKREDETIHVGSFSQSVTLLVLSCVAASYPGTMFKVTNAPTDILLDGLNSGRFDLIVATDIVRKDDFVWRRLYKEQAYLSLPGRGGFDSNEIISAEDLYEMKFVIESNVYGYTDWYAYILRKAGVPDESVRSLPIEEYLRTKDSLPESNMTSSFFRKYVGMNESRRVVAFAEDYAKRNVGLLYRRDCPDKVTQLVSQIEQDASYILSGNAYTSYFLYPENAGNLIIEDEK